MTTIGEVVQQRLDALEQGIADMRARLGDVTAGVPAGISTDAFDELRDQVALIMTRINSSGGASSARRNTLPKEMMPGVLSGNYKEH